MILQQNSNSQELLETSCYHLERLLQFCEVAYRVLESTRSILAQLANQSQSLESATEHQWFPGWGSLPCEARPWSDSPLCTRQTLGRTWRGSLHAQGAGSLLVIRGSDVRLAHWLPGNQQRSMPLTGPFDKLS